MRYVDSVFSPPGDRSRVGELLPAGAAAQRAVAAAGGRALLRRPAVALAAHLHSDLQPLTDALNGEVELGLAHTPGHVQLDREVHLGKRADRWVVFKGWG